MQAEPQSERSRVKRKPQRGRYDRATIYSIIDEALACHVGFVVDGQPYVIPTTYGRINDQLYLHGSAASRTIETLAGGVPVCVTITLLDGLVLARSARMHSMNYRSVVVFGKATEVTDRHEWIAALKAVVEHAVPGRWNEIRPPSDRELRETKMVRLPLTEASAKIREGPNQDLDADLSIPCWAGVVPLRLTAQMLAPDDKLAPGIEPSPEISDYRR